MCGIAGVWAPPGRRPPQRAELDAMVRSLHHRGPDGHGVWLDGADDGGIGLGHARLSIIDLAGGAQPMGNEDGRIQVTFNGEIFNYLELRARLVDQGHRFATASDTEVLVHLYEQHGDAFVEHLNGQFAIALWDGVRRRLVLARDRVGIRPLFFTWAHGRLAFASEVKALFALPEVPRRLDAAGLASVFSLWSVLPPSTVFEGVHTLAPGELMVVDASGTRTRRYWDWPFAAAMHDATPAWSDERWVGELRQVLADAVCLQLRADVPVGAYLSGGLDSSVITALVRHDARATLRSFSLTFDDREFDEREHQQALAQHLGAENTAIEASRADIAAAFPRMVRHAEAPVVRTAPVPMMLLADSVRRAGFKVVLTGEGADEALGGYDIFKEAAVRRFVAREPRSRWRGALLQRLYPYLARSPGAGRAMSQAYFGAGLERHGTPAFAHALRIAATQRTLGFFRADWHERLAAFDPQAALASSLPADAMRWPALARDQYLEAHTLMSGYLLSSQGDRMAMAASIEARFPFLDHRVIELACRMPARLKLCGLHEKVALRRAFAADLPPSIARRPKQPYRAPDSACFFDGGKLREETAELLSPASLDEAGLFDPAAVGRLVDKCGAGRAIGFGDNMAFVGIVSTMHLHRQFVRA